MTARWPDLAGRIVQDETGERHVLPVRVYFEDTDFSGLVYHGSYVRWFERGRSDFLRLKGNDHRALITGAGREPAAFVVRRLSRLADDPAKHARRPAARTAARAPAGDREAAARENRADDLARVSQVHQGHDRAVAEKKRGDEDVLMEKRQDDVPAAAHAIEGPVDVASLDAAGRRDQPHIAQIEVGKQSCGESDAGFLDAAV